MTAPVTSQPSVQHPSGIQQTFIYQPVPSKTPEFCLESQELDSLDALKVQDFDYKTSTSLDRAIDPRDDMWSLALKGDKDVLSFPPC